MSSAIHSPPSLPHPEGLEIKPEGSWFSGRCETRPNGLFVTRRLHFTSENNTWKGDYQHFIDQTCRKPMYMIRASGLYTIKEQSDAIAGAYHVDFHVDRLKVRADDANMADTLRKEASGTCGDKLRWATGVEQDVTSTGGCIALGIAVPHVEYELVRMRLDHDALRPTLSLGQPASDGSLPTDSKHRPTSFQSPLRPCGPPHEEEPLRATLDSWQQSNAAPSNMKVSVAGTILFTIFICIILRLR